MSFKIFLLVGHLTNFGPDIIYWLTTPRRRWPKMCRLDVRSSCPMIMWNCPHISGDRLLFPALLKLQTRVLLLDSVTWIKIDLASNYVHLCTYVSVLDRKKQANNKPTSSPHFAITCHFTINPMTFVFFLIEFRRVGWKSHGTLSVEQNIGNKFKNGLLHWEMVHIKTRDPGFGSIPSRRISYNNAPFAAEQSRGTKIAILERKWRNGTCLTNKIQIWWLSLTCPSASFALQYDDFCTTWFLSCKRPI